MGMVTILIMWPKLFEQTYVCSPILRTLHMKFSVDRSWLLRKTSLKILNLRDLDQGQWMTLTFGSYKLHVLI